MLLSHRKFNESDYINLESYLELAIWPWPLETIIIFVSSIPLGCHKVYGDNGYKIVWYNAI